MGVMYFQNDDSDDLNKDSLECERSAVYNQKRV